MSMKANLESAVWRDSRISRDRSEKQVEYKLVDMSEEQLNYAYDRCKKMLFNTEPEHLGRTLVMDNIVEQLKKCRAELAFRWFLGLKDSAGNALYTADSLHTDLRTYMSMVPKDDQNDHEYVLQDFLSVPAEYKQVSIKLLQDACRDALGVCDHSKITYSFLFKLGVYFTASELSEMDGFTEGHSLDEKFQVLKVQLGLQNDAPIKANPKGLSESEFRDMIHLKQMKGYKICKYSALTQSQLFTLQHKVLYALEDLVTKQIKLWRKLMGQIEEVAKIKGFKLE